MKTRMLIDMKTWPNRIDKEQTFPTSTNFEAVVKIPACDFPKTGKKWLFIKQQKNQINRIWLKFSC